HFDKAEAARPARLPIRDDLRPRHRAVALEQGQQVVGRGIPRKIADIDILRHRRTFPCRAHRGRRPPGGWEDHTSRVPHCRHWTELAPPAGHSTKKRQKNSPPPAHGPEYVVLSAPLGGPAFAASPRSVSHPGWSGSGPDVSLLVRQSGTRL